MQRFGRVVRIKPDKVQFYKEVHAIGWPEVLTALRRAHVTNYSIFWHGDLLFSYYEYAGDDPEGDRETFLADPTMERWQQVMETCTEPLEPGGQRWLAMEEVFHAD